MHKFALKKFKVSLGEDPQTPLDRLTVMSPLHLYTSCTEFELKVPPPNQCILL